MTSGGTIGTAHLGDRAVNRTGSGTVRLAWALHRVHLSAKDLTRLDLAHSRS